METILVSIIILTKNGEKYFRSLLEGLHCQRGIEQAEVIVIDSGSSDATLNIVADFPRVRVVQISPGEFGHGKTRNLGARLAAGKYLVYLPQDATPVGDNWLVDLIRPFENAAIVGVFGRQVPRPDASSMEAFFLSRVYHEGAEVKALSAGEDLSLTRCFFSTVSGAIRTTTWQRHPFREDVIMSEDQAWASEVMSVGHSICYEPRAKVLHSHRYGLLTIFRRNFDSGYSTQQIFQGATGIEPKAILAGLMSEAAYVATRGTVIDWLRFLPYETARHLGFWLGSRADYWHPRINRACSDLKYFWDQRGKSKTVA